MNAKKDLKIGFIGFGLIGGSIAKRIRELNPDSYLLAYNYRITTKNPHLEHALEEKCLSHVTTSLEDFAQMDIIFLCSPVLKNIEYLKKLAGIVSMDTIITDVGSVKGDICKAAESLGLSSNFIGGHPMAGSEKTSYENASAHLFENAYYIVIPGKDVSKEKTDFFLSFVKDLDSLPVVLTREEHDDIVAAISHVPHVIASSLVNMVRKNDSENKMGMLAAGGFKDITRIASSSPEMWQNICLTNKESICRFLKLYKENIDEMYQQIVDGDENALIESFRNSKDYRDSIIDGGAMGPNRVFEVYIDIQDEPGAIATIATLLATNGISIKNIGILHNREYEDGVLRLEVYDQPSIEKAITIFHKHHYTVFERN